ncbi:uncharacterized protein [Antedon mediterranea]|uniref:uncharacterized protein n=1 Tax=Antedon mediterranea TaxID=105859 RepID=UPI003AF4CED2
MTHLRYRTRNQVFNMFYFVEILKYCVLGKWCVGEMVFWRKDSGGLNFGVVGGAIIAIIIMLAIIFAMIRSKRTNTESEMSEQNNLYDNKAFVVDMTTTKPTVRPQSSGNTPKSKGQSTPSGDTSSAELPQSSGNTPKSKGQSTPSGDTSSAELSQSSGNTPKSKGQSTPSGDTSSAERPRALIDKPFHRWKPPPHVLEPPVFNKGK